MISRKIRIATLRMRPTETNGPRNARSRGRTTSISNASMETSSKIMADGMDFATTTRANSESAGIKKI